jgi:hypothetical protein
MESSAGSAHRHISSAPVLPCLLGESPVGRDRPTERRPRCGNFGCVLNLATSCCQIESRAGTKGFARTSWFLQSHGQGGAALPMSAYSTDAMGREVRFDFGYSPPSKQRPTASPFPGTSPGRFHRKSPVGCRDVSETNCSHIATPARPWHIEMESTRIR